MALNGLGRYADAIFVLRQLVSREPEDQAAQHALAECQMLQEQAFMGKYDMPALLFGRLATSFRRCADYVGPISVAYLGEGAGRGVVTTKAVKAGELLCVSSPLAAAPLATGAEMALVQGLMGAASRNPQDLALALALPSDPEGKETTVPDMMAFRRHLSKGDQDLPELPSQEVFARHAANVVKTSAIRSANSVGVYPLPSFINHSCAPNACKLLVGHTMFIHAARDLAKGEEIRVKYFDVTMPAPERQAVAKRWGFHCACPRCAMESVGEEEAAKATKRAETAAKKAREAAAANPANKKAGGDRDGSKAAAKAAAKEMEGEEIVSVAMLIASLRAKAKALHDDISSALERWKRTKGKSGAPDPNQLVELATWFEAKCDALGLDATRAAWARSSVLQVYSNINHCLSAAGQLEARAEILRKTAATLAATDPASFDHCKQLTVSLTNARRLGGATKTAAVAEAEAAAAMTMAIRYGCGVGEGEEEIARELIKHAELSAEEGRREFCEA